MHRDDPHSLAAAQQGTRHADRVIRAPRGTERTARSWLTEAPLRMLMNNLDPDVAENPQELVVYGGIGRAALPERPVDEIEQLRFLLYKSGFGPGLLPPQWPEHPSLVGALDDGVRVDRRPAVDVMVVAAPLHQERPEPACLVVAVGRGAVGVAEERPQIRFADGGGSPVERIEW